MSPSATTLPLRLTQDDGAPNPVGLVLARAAARDMVLKLDARLAHYASLRLFATVKLLVLLSPECTPLPWSAEVMFFLYQRGPAILPIGQRLDVPARWHDDVVTRLAAARDQSLPLLILPGETGELQIAGLRRARAATDIDLPALATACAPE